jgi:hypothetical protein
MISYAALLYDWSTVVVLLAFFDFIINWDFRVLVNCSIAVALP